LRVNPDLPWRVWRKKTLTSPQGARTLKVNPDLPSGGANSDLGGGERAIETGNAHYPLGDAR